MTYFAGKLKPAVIRASPVGHGATRSHARASCGPAAAWMAPQTPPPGRRPSLAAFTIASMSSVVMSASTADKEAAS
jgi:hypothetical protein